MDAASRLAWRQVGVGLYWLAHGGRSDNGMAEQLERGTCARFGPVSPILNDSMYIYSSKLEIGAVYFA